MRLSLQSRSFFLLLVIVTLTLAMLSGPGLAAPRPKLGSMSGTVSSAGGTRLAGVTVEAWLAPGGDPAEASLAASSTTQRNGGWQIKNLQFGVYLVRFVPATSEAYMPIWYDGAPTLSLATPVMVQSTAVVRNIDAVLSAPGTISGRVLEPNLATEDPDDYLPVAGMEVGAHVQGFDRLELVGELAVSNAYGYFIISGLPSGEYYLIGNDPNGYHTMAWGGDALCLTPDNPSAERDLFTSPSGAIAGRVTDVDGNGLAGLLIEAFTMKDYGWGPEPSYVTQGSTDADGYYFLGGVPQGTPAIVRASQHESLAAMFYGGDGDEVPVADFAADVNVINGQTTTSIDIQLAVGGGVISGRVTEPDGSTPIWNVCVNAQLWYTDDWYTVANVWTLEDGTYSITGLYPGTYHLSFFPLSNSGFLEESYHDKPTGPGSGDAITVTDSETVTIDESLAVAAPQE